MMAVARGEWLRLHRQPVNRVILLLLGMVLVAAAMGSGLAARDYRLQSARQEGDWLGSLATQRAQAQQRETAQGPPSTDRAAADAFEIGRQHAPRIALQGLGGLSLAPYAAERRDTRIAIGIEGRHTDARRTEPLRNPLLASLDGLDLAWLVALLVPLAILALSHGLVQEEREQGRWRLVCAQARRPFALLMVALGWRAAAVFAVAAGATTIAFAIDPGATVQAWLAWLAALAGFVWAWTALAGLANALPVSSAGAALFMIGIWLLTSFVLPPLATVAAARSAPMPSRLATLVQIRQLQQEAETASDSLLQTWYRTHPEHRPRDRSSHAWPVSFVPRYLWLDAAVRPLMARFDQARAAQADELAPWAAVSPALSMMRVAEALAGVDSRRYARYAQEVDRREDAWRARLVPAVMSYRGIKPADVDLLARVGAPAAIAPSGPDDRATLWGTALLLTTLLLCLRRRVEGP